MHRYTIVLFLTILIHLISSERTSPGCPPNLDWVFDTEDVINGTVETSRVLSYSNTISSTGSVQTNVYGSLATVSTAAIPSLVLVDGTLFQGSITSLYRTTILDAISYIDSYACTSTTSTATSAASYTALEGGAIRCFTNGMSITSNMVVTGTTNSWIVFRITGALTTSNNIVTSLSSTMQEANIFYLVSGNFNTGNNARLVGNIILRTGSTVFGSGALLNGRVYCIGATCNIGFNGNVLLVNPPATTTCSTPVITTNSSCTTTPTFTTTNTTNINGIIYSQNCTFSTCSTCNTTFTSTIYGESTILNTTRTTNCSTVTCGPIRINGFGCNPPTVSTYTAPFNISCNLVCNNNTQFCQNFVNSNLTFSGFNSSLSNCRFSCFDYYDKCGVLNGDDSTCDPVFIPETITVCLKDNITCSPLEIMQSTSVTSVSELLALPIMVSVNASTPIPASPFYGQFVNGALYSQNFYAIRFNWNCLGGYNINSTWTRSQDQVFGCSVYNGSVSISRYTSTITFRDYYECATGLNASRLNTTNLNRIGELKASLNSTVYNSTNGIKYLSNSCQYAINGTYVVSTYNITTLNRIVINQITINPQSLTTNRIGFTYEGNEFNANFETCYSTRDRASGLNNTITNIQITPDQVVPLFVLYETTTYQKPGDPNTTCLSWKSFTTGNYFLTNTQFIYNIRYIIEINGVPYYFNVEYEILRSAPVQKTVNFNVNPDPPFVYNLLQCYYADEEKTIPYTRFSSGNRMYIDLNLVPNTITASCSDTNCYKHPLYNQYINLVKGNICAVDTNVVIPPNSKCDDINPNTGQTYGKKYFLFDTTTGYLGGTWWQTIMTANNSCSLRYTFSFIQRPLRSYSIQQFLEIEYLISAGLTQSETTNSFDDISSNSQFDSQYSRFLLQYYQNEQNDSIYIQNVKFILTFFIVIIIGLVLVSFIVILVKKIKNKV